MGYIILNKPYPMPLGHDEESIPIKMFDMRYEDYPPDTGVNKLGQYSPVIGKIPGSFRNYFVWDGENAKITKLAPEQLQDILKQGKQIGQKLFKYTMLPDNWYQYAVRV